MSLPSAYRNLAGKRAVLVGGATGIGRGVTLALARAGVDIVTCDVDEAGVRQIVPEASALGVKIVAEHVDVRDAAELDGFFDRIERDGERVDFLINVAGGARRRPFTDTSREENDEAIRLNYGYILDSVRRTVPLIRNGGAGGAIVNFTTIEAHRGAAGYAAYAGAKAATTNFTRALAVELGPEQIRANLIVPDTTPSRAPFRADGAAKDHFQGFSALSEATRSAGVKMYIPQGRAPTIEDLANAVLFLVSDLSRAITGIGLHVDGGTSASMGFLQWPFGDSHGPSPQPETLRKLFEDGSL